MAFFNKKEFADKCGMETKHLSTYIKRKQIKVVQKDGQDMFDGNDPVNKAFLAARKGKQSEKQLVKEMQQRHQAETINKPRPHTEAFEKIMNGDQDEDFELGSGDDDDDNQAIMSFDVATKKHKHWQAVKTERESRLLLLKEQKLKGIVIPSDLVKPLFLQHNQSLTSEFKNGAEDLLRTVAQKKGMTNDEKSELKGELIKIINRALENATEMTIKNLGNIINEYSIKKSVGERG